jgi:hypothetical protein
MRDVVVQGVDVNPVASEIVHVDVTGTVFLGCEMMSRAMRRAVHASGAAAVTFVKNVRWTIVTARPLNLSLLGSVQDLCGPLHSDEQQMDVTLEDYLGCWISIEPSALTIETDYNKPDGDIVRIESMMLSIERVDSGPEFRNLVKGAFEYLVR